MCVGGGGGGGGGGAGNTDSFRQFYEETHFASQVPFLKGDKN